MPSEPKHVARATTIAIRSPTAMEVVDGRDKDRDRDNRAAVARPKWIRGMKPIQSLWLFPVQPGGSP